MAMCFCAQRHGPVGQRSKYLRKLMKSVKQGAGNHKQRGKEGTEKKKPVFPTRKVNLLYRETVASAHEALAQLVETFGRQPSSSLKHGFPSHGACIPKSFKASHTAVRTFSD